MSGLEDAFTPSTKPMTGGVMEYMKKEGSNWTFIAGDPVTRSSPQCSAVS
jgi:hypothetical protein